MSQLADVQPWSVPIWAWSKGKGVILFYLVLVHLLAFAGLVLFPLPSLPVLGGMLLLIVLGGFGTTVCYHRLLAHRTLKVNRLVEQVLIFWTIFNGSGAPASWAAYHRLHHAKADTLEDISSPSWGGFWWAHLRWLYQTPPADVKRWAPDLDRPPYSVWALAQIPTMALSLCVGLPFGWEAFFWLGAIRLVYSLHLQCFVNSLLHMGAPNELGETAKNLWWLGPLQLSAWGENWHANHHRYANSARLGLTPWQIDVGWYFIWILERLGLATGVKRPVAVGRSRSKTVERDAEESAAPAGPGFHSLRRTPN